MYRAREESAALPRGIMTEEFPSSGDPTVPLDAIPSESGDRVTESSQASGKFGRFAVFDRTRRMHRRLAR